jgi:hypothetical protein
MFRRLFNLEVSALRDQVEDFRHRVENAETQLADTARELLAINRDSRSPGIWNFRSPV